MRILEFLRLVWRSDGVPAPYGVRYGIRMAWWVAGVVTETRRQIRREQSR